MFVFLSLLKQGYNGAAHNVAHGVVVDVAVLVKNVFVRKTLYQIDCEVHAFRYIGNVYASFCNCAVNPLVMLSSSARNCLSTSSSPDARLCSVL